MVLVCFGLDPEPGDHRRTSWIAISSWIAVELFSLLPNFPFRFRTRGNAINEAQQRLGP